MLRKIFFLIFVCLIYSTEYKGNQLEARALEGADIKKPNIFFIDIYCHHEDEIAGVQFELPNYFKLLNVEEIRTKDMNFEFHHNTKGLVLGFSMSGETISPTPRRYPRKQIAYNGEVVMMGDSITLFCRLQVEYLGLEADQIVDSNGFNLDSKIKTILASQTGKRLEFDFSRYASNISFSDGPKLITFNFSTE